MKKKLLKHIYTQPLNYITIKSCLIMNQKINFIIKSGPYHSVCRKSDL